jgi:hypothetical protein
MSRGPKNHPRPGLPVVNLLSPAAFDLLAARRLRIRFAVGALALVVLAAGLWTVQHLRISETRKLVAVEQAETARLNSETRTLLPVKAYVAGVASQQQTVSTTMAREIFFSRVLDGIRRATPVGASLDNVAITLAAADPVVAAPATAGAAGAPAPAAPAAPTVSPCPGPDPFNTKPVIGCITLSGTAATRSQVGDLVIALSRSGMFVEPFISTTSAADQSVTFSGSVGLSQKAYSKRYAKPETTK